MRIVSSGKGIHSPEFYERKKKKQRLQFIFISIGFLLILFSLVYVSRREGFLITEVTVLGENIVDRPQIDQRVAQLLSGYYLWLVPRTNFFIYPRRTIKQSLTEEFPRLRSVELDVIELGTLVVSVEERVPSSLYCLDIPGPVNRARCFFIDEEGLIFASAPTFSDGVYFIYSTEEALENPIGKRLMSTEEFWLLSTFLESLGTLNIHPKALQIADDEYRLFLSSGAELLWGRESELALTRLNLESFLADKSIKAQGDFLNRILYLDLRTLNKVFYRFKY
ncbi:MAG: hypothetical protein WD896_02300 [Parcubacteria group bacterium]